MMSENTKTKNQRPKTEKIIWLLLAVIVVAVYFFGLTIPLVGPDEPRYAQVAREMFLRGDWVTPTLGAANWFEKPALLYWLQITAYKIFGVNEFAARFGSALFGLGTIFCLWILGSQTSTENPPSAIRHPQSKWFALVAASSIGLIAFSRGASFDIILTFPVCAALTAFFIFDQSKRQTGFAFHFSLFSFYFFIGIALLAKGLIGAVFPLAIVAFYFLLSRRLPNKFFIFSLFWGAILSLTVAASWYVPMYLRHGWTFIDEFFVQHHFQRYTSNKYQHPQPFHFFFWVLPLMTLPWLPFFIEAIWRFIKNIFQRRDAGETQRKDENKLSPFHPFTLSPLHLFAFAWLLVPLVFFTFSGSKLPGYILPALPAALILTGDAVFRFVQKSTRRKRIVQSIAFITFVFVAAAVQFFVPAYARLDSTKHLFATANAAGYADARVLNLHTVSHNAEFYAAGRLIRNADGKLRTFYGVSEIVEELKREPGRAVLVLVPPEYLYQLNESPEIEAKRLEASAELIIFAVKLKEK